MVTICYVCRRLRLEGKWKGNVEIVGNVLISHGLCDSCGKKELDKVEEWLKIPDVKLLTGQLYT